MVPYPQKQPQIHQRGEVWFLSVSCVKTIHDPRDGWCGEFTVALRWLRAHVVVGGCWLAAHIRISGPPEGRCSPFPDLQSPGRQGRDTREGAVHPATAPFWGTLLCSGAPSMLLLVEPLLMMLFHIGGGVGPKHASPPGHMPRCGLMGRGCQLGLLMLGPHMLCCLKLPVRFSTGLFPCSASTTGRVTSQGRCEGYRGD